MNSRKFCFSQLCLVCVLIGLMACSSEETVTPEIPGPSAASLLRTAWTHFEEGDYAGALDFFDRTLVVDSDSFEAHLGRGWSLLKSSASAASLIEVDTAFDQALLLETADSDALGGRAAARLSLGGAELAGAVEDAGVVLQQDPDYEFQHDPVFNDSALRIIQAQAQIALEDYDSALLALDTIYVSGIRAENSNTWVVEGLIESSFGAAVIAHLDRIERLWLGGDL